MGVALSRNSSFKMHESPCESNPLRWYPSFDYCGREEGAETAPCRTTMRFSGYRVEHPLARYTAASRRSYVYEYDCASRIENVCGGREGGGEERYVGGGRREREGYLRAGGR